MLQQTRSKRWQGGFPILNSKKVSWLQIRYEESFRKPRAEQRGRPFEGSSEESENVQPTSFAARRVSLRFFASST